MSHHADITDTISYINTLAPPLQTIFYAGLALAKITLQLDDDASSSATALPNAPGPSRQKRPWDASTSSEHSSSAHPTSSTLPTSPPPAPSSSSKAFERVFSSLRSTLLKNSTLTNNSNKINQEDPLGSIFRILNKGKGLYEKQASELIERGIQAGRELERKDMEDDFGEEEENYDEEEEEEIYDDDYDEHGYDCIEQDDASASDESDSCLPPVPTPDLSREPFQPKRLFAPLLPAHAHTIAKKRSKKAFEGGGGGAVAKLTKGSGVYWLQKRDWPGEEEEEGDSEEEREREVKEEEVEVDLMRIEEGKGKGRAKEKQSKRRKVAQKANISPFHRHFSLCI